MLEVRIGNREAGGTDVLRSTAEAIAMHDTRMTPDFNYTLERSLGGDSRLHATETRPRVCEPSGKARLRSEVTPHVRRHCFATPLLKAGTAIRTVQDLLGHESVETTQIYPPVMQKPGLGVRSPLDGRGC